MKSVVIVFPGSNCDRDAADALERITGQRPDMIWHRQTDLPDGLDLVVLPGGFSYGDYLRAGAMSARAPIINAVKAHGARGGLVLGICNGFQILTEARMLPGAVMANAGLRFVCREVTLEIANGNTRFTRAYRETRETKIPVAHADGRYVADEATLDQLENEGRIPLRYKDNPNGSARNIAAVLNAGGNVMGMMPHPERVSDPSLGRMGGWAIFQSLNEAA